MAGLYSIIIQSESRRTRQLSTQRTLVPVARAPICQIPAASVCAFLNETRKTQLN